MPDPICDNCKIAFATIHIIEVSMGDKKEVHLCEICAREKAKLHPEIMNLAQLIERPKVILYCFDIDDSLEVSNGPIPLKTLMDLRCQGHIVGLNGNFVPVLRVAGWQHLISFFNPGMDKAQYMQLLRNSIVADDYVMVGNILGVSGGSDDQGAAARAGWRFIKESDFAAGTR